MDLIDSNIEAYSQSFSDPESALLKELNRETYALVLQPRMISGHLQGRRITRKWKTSDARHQ